MATIYKFTPIIVNEEDNKRTIALCLVVYESTAYIDV